MDKEFPQLDEVDYQKEFLSDWWSESKLFRGNRQSGKSTLMLCEAKRFSDCGFSTVFFAPRQSMAEHLKREYQGLFSEQPTFDFESYHTLGNRGYKGFQKDVVILDEFQETSFETYNREIAPMNPSFVRASACKSSMDIHWLQNAKSGNNIAFFDSIYED